LLISTRFLSRERWRYRFEIQVAHEVWSEEFGLKKASSDFYEKSLTCLARCFLQPSFPMFLLVNGST
jgi:hypothetical protein